MIQQIEASARNCRRVDSVMVKFLNSEKSTVSNSRAAHNVAAFIAELASIRCWIELLERASG